MAENEVTENAETTEEAPAPDETDSASTKINFEGKEYSVEELVQEVRNRGLRRDDYTKKTMELAEERKDLERMRAEVQAQMAQRQSPEEDFSDMDEVVPGLSKLARLNQSIDKRLAKLEERQEQTDKEAAEYVKTQEHEDAMESAVEEWGSKPFADKKELRSFMEENGLPPSQAALAYSALYGYKLGGKAKEEAMKKRGAHASPPMKGSGVGLTASMASEAPANSKPMSQTSWQELRNKALADPRRPKI